MQWFFFLAVAETVIVAVGRENGENKLIKVMPFNWLEHIYSQHILADPLQWLLPGTVLDEKWPPGIFSWGH